MKPYIDPNLLHRLHNPHDAFDREIKALTANIEMHPSARDQVCRIARAAFFAGRNQLVDELNEDASEGGIQLQMNTDDYPGRTDMWFKNLGKFVLGSGFRPADAVRLQIGWDLARGGDKAVYCIAEHRAGDILIHDVGEIDLPENQDGPQGGETAGLV